MKPNKIIPPEQESSEVKKKTSWTKKIPKLKKRNLLKRLRRKEF
jgi:hypothetical protein